MPTSVSKTPQVKVTDSGFTLFCTGDIVVRLLVLQHSVRLSKLTAEQMHMHRSEKPWPHQLAIPSEIPSSSV
jgi:hypothetical protein